jgi:hypothetical protein
MGDYALAVRVEEGRHFPRDEATVFRVAAVFDDEPQSTPFASPSAFPFWGTTLAWEVPTDRLKRVQSTGTGQLKLTGACAGSKHCLSVLNGGETHLPRKASPLAASPTAPRCSSL